MWSLEITDKALGQDKASFDLTVKSVRWATTTGLKFFLQFWYSKTPMFALPRGWFPWQVEWILSFPRAPLGTVSIQVWSAACGTAVSIIGDTVAYVVVSMRSSGTSKQKSAPIKVGGAAQEKKSE
jgi:hypothetical protein